MASDKERSQNFQYYRIIQIDSEISSGNFPNSNTLAKKYEVSSATIKRDIEYMRDMFNAPILYDKYKYGYYYKDKTFRLPALFVNEEEAYSGAIALKLLAQYVNTPIYKHIKNIFDNFDKILSEGNANNKSWVENRVVFLEEPVPNIDKNIWENLIKAIIDNKVVSFFYNGIHNNKNENYTIAPYQIICKKGVWYLAGHNSHKNSIHLYALHRIKSIKITDEHFELEQNYRYYKTTDKLFGVYSFDERIECKIQFFNETATYISERQWADDQELNWQDDGSIIMTFSSGQLYEVLIFILSHGANALPLSPTELVCKWESQVDGMFTLKTSINRI